MQVIIVTGTPGTGKSTLAKNLAQASGYLYINGNTFIRDNDLAESYDSKRKCYIVDEKKLAHSFISFLTDNGKKYPGFIFDSHLSQFIPKKYVDHCIVTSCDLAILKRRLAKRRYAKQKIRENLDAEIFSVCSTEAQEAGHNVHPIDTSGNVHHTKQLVAKSLPKLVRSKLKKASKKQ